MLSPVKLWRNQKRVADLLGKTGRIIAWTVVRVPPVDFSDQAPYPVAVVELENKERITAQLVDLLPDEQREKPSLIGRKVLTVIRRVRQPNAEGIIPYGIKVKLL